MDVIVWKNYTVFGFFLIMMCDLIKIYTTLLEKQRAYDIFPF